MANFREPVTVALECPVEDMGKIVDRVTIHRHLTGRDMMELDGLSDMAQSLRLIELLCALPRETVEQLWVGDVGAIAAAMTPFVERSRRTGKGRLPVSP